MITGAVLCGLLLGGCGGSDSGMVTITPIPHSQPQAPSAEPVEGSPVPGLGDLGDIAGLLRTPFGALPGESLIQAISYETSLPNSSIAIAGDSLEFQPDWAPGSNGPDGLAYAMYTWDLPDFTGDPQLNLSWTTPPDTGACWLGLAEPLLGVWQWFAWPDSQSLGLGEMARWQTAEGRILACVVVTGTEPVLLNWLRLGPNLAPTAALEATPTAGTAPLSVVFSAAASSDSDGEITNYRWDYEGDGQWDTTTTTPESAHLYPSGGYYSAKVEVTDNSSAVDTTAVQITVAGPPTADLALSPAVGNAPLEVLLDASGSSDPGGALVLFEWDVDGDGTFEQDTGTDSWLLHIYTEPGDYQPTVRVTDDDANTATDSGVVEVNTGPKARISVSPTSGRAPLPIYPSGSASTGGAGIITEYAWDWEGDGTYDYTSGLPDVDFHVYLRPGGHNLTLQVTNSLGEKDIATEPITVSGWITSWGGSSSDYFNGVGMGPAGELIAVGGTNSFGAGNTDVLLARYDSNGLLSWVKTWGGGLIDKAERAVIDNDGNIIVVGYTFSYAVAGNDDFLVLKYQPDGTLLWATTWGRAYFDWAHDVAVDASGNILVAGNSRNETWNSMNDMAVLMFTPGGPLAWERVFNSFGEDEAPYIVSDGSGGFFITGRTDSEEGNSIDCLLLHVAGNGDLQLVKWYGGELIDAFYRASLGADDFLYVAGYTRSFYGWAESAIMTKMAQDGTVAWTAMWDAEGQDVLTGAVAAGDSVYGLGVHVDTSNNWYGLVLEFDAATGELLDSLLLDASGNTELWGVAGNGGLQVIGTGSCQDAYGEWVPIAGDASLITLEHGTMTYEWTDEDGTLNGPEGFYSLPEGTVDIGGGSTDALLFGYAVE